MEWVGYLLLGFASVVMTVYAAMIFFAISGWKNLKIEEEKHPTLGVSILVAARNEADNIETIVRDVFNQSYPLDLFELIVPFHSIPFHSEGDGAAWDKSGVVVS